MNLTTDYHDAIEFLSEKGQEQHSNSGNGRTVRWVGMKIR